MSKTFKILSPTAILGYGFPEESFMRAMEESPDLIAVDAGSSTQALTIWDQENHLLIARG